jgi:hypothetical protein
MDQGKCKKRAPIVDYMEVTASNWPEVTAFCTAIHEDGANKVMMFARPGEYLVRNEFGRVDIYTAEQFRHIFERVIE